MDRAEKLTQVRGYNGFSYADIAAALKITNASLHYHFPTKAELGQQLMERYTQNFLAALAVIDEACTSAREKLKRYVAIYSDVLAMCLCSILAAEHATLPKPVKLKVTRFFDLNATWLAKVLEQSKQTDGLKLVGSLTEAARLFIAALEGAMMLARSYGDVERFNRAGQHLLADIL